MARGITEADVLEAADALLTRGERPTIERVRQELGRGSPNTVNRHLDAWWTSLAQRLQGRSGSTLPASLLELCGRLYAGVCQQAQAEAQATLTLGDERLRTALADLEAEKNALLLERAGAAAASEKLVAELTALRNRNEALAGEKAQLQGQIERSASSAALATAAAKTSSAALEAAQAKHQAEVQRIRGQWEGNEKRWLDEIGHLRDDAKRQRGEYEAQIKALREQVNAAERTLAASLKARTDLETDAARSKSLLAKEREARIQAEAASNATKALVQSLQKRSPEPPRRRRIASKAESS